MYVALEIKKTTDTTMETSTVVKETKELAMQAYYEILSRAAVSTAPVHTAMLINEYGAVIKCETCKHEEV